MGRARQHVIVVGGGVGGLAAAIDLAANDVRVTLFERAPRVGGKIQDTAIDGCMIDGGPTVLTKRAIFDELFIDAGDRLERHIALKPLDVLARHAWSDGSRLDLFADLDRSEASIAAFAGAREADGYRRFARDAQRTFETLDAPFMQTDRPGLPLMLGRIAARGIPGLIDMWKLQPYASLWRELGRYFADWRMRQLFARYATYCGGSPFQAPATLMLVAHLERLGVWRVEGGIQRLADALGALAQRLGVEIRTGAHVRTIACESGRVVGVALGDGRVHRSDAVVFNGDVAALSAGLLGDDVTSAVSRAAIGRRSLSAITVSLLADTRGMQLAHHNVFFASDYRAEFDAIRHGQVPLAPTVYVCAPDDHAAASTTPRRLFCLMNAPANGDETPPFDQEHETWRRRIFSALQRCGLDVTPASDVRISTPFDFHRRFPGTGGALYGPAPHQVMSAFRRSTTRSRIPGLYLAGGSIHPGPGVPMAAMSGRRAARCLLADLASRTTWHPVAMPGGTSTA